MDATVVSDELFEQVAALGFGDVHLRNDPTSGLQAIVAVHSTRLGPAFGGTRCIPYPTSVSALRDCLRLARGMSYKAAIAGLPFGGGKAVIMRPASPYDRRLLFAAFGEFVDSLQGRFITAVDSGTTVEDMDVIATRTRFVSSTSGSGASHGDPSPYTALGVCRAMEAVADARGRPLSGMHVKIQGVGHVGHALAGELHARGVRLTVCDIDPQLAARCAREFGAEVVEPDLIYSVSADIFSPCALGGAINDETSPRLNAQIVCGAANNQLDRDEHGDALHQRGVLYVPDYVCNAGGLIHAVPGPKNDLRARVDAIYDTVRAIVEEAERSARAPHRVADAMAERILYGP